jgi:hypothetical protein
VRNERGGAVDWRSMGKSMEHMARKLIIRRGNSCDEFGEGCLILLRERRIQRDIYILECRKWRVRCFRRITSRCAETQKQDFEEPKQEEANYGETSLEARNAVPCHIASMLRYLVTNQSRQNNKKQQNRHSAS